MFTKNQGQNLGQNHDNLMNFLVKDYECSPEITENLTEEAAEANIVKSIIFKGKKPYRVVKTDSFDTTILVPDTQTGNSEDERTDNDTTTIFPEESTTENNIVEKREESISVLIENKFSFLIQSIEKDNIEDKIIGFQNVNLPRNSVNPTTPENNLYVELLKNRISDLEKQLTEKNVIINLLTTQLVAKSQDTSVHNNIQNNKHEKGTRINNGDKVDDVPLKRSINKTSNNKTSNNVVVIGDSILNNINARGLSKSKKFDVLNFPGATSSDIVNDINEVLKGKPESLIIHIDTNDLTNNINLLTNVKKTVNKVKKTSPDNVLSFSDVVF